MSGLHFSRLSLLWKILLSTSVAITVLFSVTGWFVENAALDTTSRSLDQEVQASFQAYRSLWQSRADRLASMSLLLSQMSDVRRVFGTGDPATIRDTASELWSTAAETALLLVTDPKGRVIASVGSAPDPAAWRELDVVPEAAQQFTQRALGSSLKDPQANGFMLKEGNLYQVAITPVYVQSGSGMALLDVLVAGYQVDHLVAQNLKDSTGGSEFLFLAGGRVIASTLNPRATRELARVVAARGPGQRFSRISDGVTEFAPLEAPLTDIEGPHHRRVVDLPVVRKRARAARCLAAQHCLARFVRRARRSGTHLSARAENRAAG